MSDFFNVGWSVYIAAIVIGGLVFCLALLIIASRRKVMADDNSTGHVWDEDLKEMNNPLPRWWMGLFVLTVVFANRGYQILRGELVGVGAKTWGERAERMLSIVDPDISWVKLAEGMGVEAAAATTSEELVRLIPGARAYVLPDGGHFYPNVHGGEFRLVMTSFLLESP